MLTMPVASPSPWRSPAAVSMRQHALRDDNQAPTLDAPPPRDGAALRSNGLHWDMTSSGKPGLQSLRSRVARLAAGCLLAVDAAGATPPSFADLEAAGARIGQVRVLTRDIFDTDDPREDRLPFRWANALHVKTRRGVIERALLFRPGEAVSVRLIEETERLLREAKYLYDVEIRPAAVREGVVDIEVVTRDTWTLDPGISAGRSGGANTSSFGIKEDNLLGTGISLGFSRFNGIDRSGTQFEVVNPQVFGSRTALSVSRARNSDGRRDAVSVLRPFYALDTRWAAGASFSRDDRIDVLYDAGNPASSYRRRDNRGEVFAGLSSGLVGGWVQRWSAGVELQDDGYAVEPGATAPTRLPGDERFVAPFVRYQLVEDRFEKLGNRDLIGRPEFFALGLMATVQVGRAAPGLGSDRSAWLYAGEASRGFEDAAGRLLTASASVAGHTEDGRAHRLRLGAKVRYYLPQGAQWLFYASASGDLLRNPNPTESLPLGGDNGLRGYPLRYQNGRQRALFTLEERFYTDLFPLRLYRVGGAAFLDVGRAWGGDSPATGKAGWLGNVGFGLRFFSVRTAFSNVVHVDLAFPIDPDTDVKRVQLLVKTKASF